MTNADLRLELFDGMRWVPMEFSRDNDAVTFENLCEAARTYVRRGAAKSIRVQQRYITWHTISTITMMIKETTEPTLRCTCGHQYDRHAVGDVCLIKNCPCLTFELRAV